VLAEPVFLGELEKRQQKKQLTRKVIKNTATQEDKDLLNFITAEENSLPPTLTEAVIFDLLKTEGIDCISITYDDLFKKSVPLEKYLRDTDCVMLSTTLLRDLSELESILPKVKRPHNKVIAGGALTGTLYETWGGSELMDIMAIGYGEMLVPALASWIKSGYQALTPPPRGRMLQKNHTQFLFSGVPESLSLDNLPTPNWQHMMDYHQKKFKMIYYESVRGCPYRCAFCNYPYLFDDLKFRTKSAAKMADDWKKYQDELGIEYITCLDSLFTMPKQRLIDFCNLLIEKNVKIKWIAYARADDLTDESVVRLMKQAGAYQVQIGIESGDAQMLENMNKRVDPETNALAIENCRKHGLTTLVSLIIGFPGETKETLETTFQFMKKYPPDFYFLATYSARVPGVPILEPKNKEKFGLKVMDNSYTVSPYWVHDTMSCADVGEHTRELGFKLMRDKVSLDATLFFSGLLSYKPELKERLLELQKNAVDDRPLAQKPFHYLHSWIDKRLARDVASVNFI
jgi:anaerobic magnesium-protoporphyrin IX monomethyl ester cyclase